MQEYRIDGHVSSFLPDGKNWKLVWNDEFDGNLLDESKWNFRRQFWGYDAPNFTDEGVEVSGGTLKINLVRDGDDLLLLELDGKVAANLGSLEGWTDVELIADQSGYDSGELIGSPVYYFTFDGFENRRYSTVEFSYFPDSGKVNRTDGVDVGN